MGETIVVKFTLDELKLLVTAINKWNPPIANESNVSSLYDKLFGIISKVEKDKEM
jgi:hypothetical protein